MVALLQGKQGNDPAHDRAAQSRARDLQILAHRAGHMQVLVDRDGDEQDQEMALLGPGKLLQVSNVVGRGFSSLFNSYVGLMSAMEESRDLLLIGASIPLMHLV